MGQRQDAETTPCPCGSGKLLPDCCGPLLSGERLAATAEQLMRSRYTANVYADGEYLIASWHPSTRPVNLRLDHSGVQWVGLEVVGGDRGTVQDSEGTVEFIAHYRVNHRDGLLHEVSRFVREDGRWYYLDGVVSDEMQADGVGRQDNMKGSNKVGRNTPCPCGSGRKYKQCCGQR